MITTIQLHSTTKAALASLIKENETYEEVIKRLISVSEMRKQHTEKLLIESCKVMAEDSLKICKEFDAIEPAWPEWKE